MSTTEEQSGVRRTGVEDFDWLAADRDLLGRSLADVWHARRSDQLDRIAEYALIPAGKLLRPLLVLESARAVGGSCEDVAELALAVEYLHVATLAHDDIIDQDYTRRGRPSVQAAYGVPAAIIVGDGLLLETFATLTGSRPAGVSDADIVAVVSAMASAGLGLCRGQLLESEFVGNLNCTVDQYLTMAQLKTGVLFESACEIGAILGGRHPRWVPALAKFGRHLGAGFQIRDDLLGFDGAAAPIGKPRESDVHNRRPTLPMLLAYQSAGADGRRRLERVFSGKVPEAEAFDAVRAVVQATGARQAAAEYAAEEIRRAKRCLAELPPGDSVAVLRGLADYATGRNS